MTLRLEDIRWEGLFPRQSSGHDFSRFEALHQDRKILVTGAGGSIGAADRLARALFERELPGLLGTLTQLVPEYEPSNYLREQVVAMEQR